MQFNKPLQLLNNLWREHVLFDLPRPITFSLTWNVHTSIVRKAQNILNEENGVRLDIATNGWKELAPYYLSQLKGVDAQKIKFLHARIWLSLTTYAWEDYDSICGAFYKGVMLMDECLKDN